MESPIINTFNTLLAAASAETGSFSIQSPAEEVSEGNSLVLFLRTASIAHEELL